MGRDTDIATKLRAFGLRVIETEGWRTRGSNVFSPRGSVNHHTACGPRGVAPSLGVVINGRSDLSGPLCNVLQSREPDGNDIFYVIAAGRANHAGTGGWRELSGNSSVYGLEIEHTGIDPLPESRQRLAARCHAALGRGLFDERYVCQHFEWATPPGRKTDAATHVDPGQFRATVGSFIRDPRLPSVPAPQVERIFPNMFMIGTTEQKYFLLTTARIQQIPAEEYFALAGVGIPHQENQNPLVLVRHQQALNLVPPPAKDKNWGT